MKENSYGIFHRIISCALAVIMMVMLAPIGTAIGDEPISNRVADSSTMDSWKQWFGNEITHTEYAGGVWTDKSVFTDASAFPSGTVTLDGENNFLVALSALAANKTIVGYTHLPSDTVFVLDVSGSMAGRAEALVEATNTSIKTLMSLNNHNRVSVVLYSDSTTVLLPLDRYTSEDENGDFLSYSKQNNSEYVGVAEKYVAHQRKTVSLVKNSEGKEVSGKRQVTGGTFIQGGIYGALSEFNRVEDVAIQEGFQSGTTRIPIFVLMSDGAPTYGTTNYTQPGSYDLGTGAHTNEGMAFLTQLTAAYSRERVEEKYGRKALFYSLGLIDGVSDDDIDDVRSVLDPVGNTQSLWDGYFKLTNRQTLAVSIPAYGRGFGVTTTTATVSRNSVITTESVDYADGAFYASNSAGLIEKFQAVVDEIILQSRYYPTHLQGGSPDFSGYITFEDYIGEYMEVKDIKGILLGDVLFDGAMLTSKINDSSDGLGTIDNPTELGHEFIEAIKTRLGIADTKDAQDLAALAVHYGQLYYNGEDDFSNYIGWYAKADGSFHSFWHEGMTEHPVDAAYINRSYGFLGQADGNIKDSDMMYMSVQVHTNIKSGHQAVMWSIPASLVPMVTYSVSLEGNSVENATNVELDIVEAAPIRLVFETGLRSDINELNVNVVMAAAEGKFKTSDGYRFWTNRWEDNGSVANDIGTKVAYAPSVENERYYFNEDCDIYISDGDGYSVASYKNASEFNSSTKYYRRRTVFALTENANDGKAADVINKYEELTASVLNEKRQRDDGTWYIPMGTVSHLVDDFVLNKSENATDSLGYVIDPYVQQTVSSYEEHSILGNNGRFDFVPAQGIAITKTLDSVEPGATNEFEFVISLKSSEALAEDYKYILADAGKYVGEEGRAEVVDGEIRITLAAGKTIYIVGIPTGTEYSVSEIAHEAYNVKSVSVNGAVANGFKATGKITAQSIDNVEFINTPAIKGSLIIQKSVSHPFGSDYVVPSDRKFDISVKLSGGNTANQTFEAVTSSGATELTSDENGVVSFKLAHGESISIHGIPDGTQYSVTESNLPSGFSVSNESKNLKGRVVGDTNVTALLVNAYSPEPVAPSVEINVIKRLLGREFKEGDSFEFLLERYDGNEGDHYVETDRATVTAMKDAVNGELVATMTLSNELLTKAGYYSFVISEVNAKALGNGIAGVSYDTTLRHFAVTVSDNDMDGKLEIAEVTAIAPVTVSKNQNGYMVNASFTNQYQATVGASVNININKEISSPSGALIGKNGFSFALYDESGSKIVGSNLTDANGKAAIELSFPVSYVGTSVTYFLREEVHSTPISGMTYSDAEHKLVIEFVDNLDGTVGTVINGVKTDSVDFSFTNVYDPVDASLILSGKKLLNGRILNENEFSFSLYETDSTFNTNGLDPIETVWAHYDGSFSFSLLGYDTVETKYYVVAENNTALGGVTYDNTKYNVTVEVTAEGAILVAKTTITANGAEVSEIEFVNEYNVTPVSIVLGGEKVLSGRDIKDGEFEFKLVDSDGSVVSTAKNIKNLFSFDKLEYTKAGVYSYTVSEIDTELGGIGYDTSVYEVTVTVTDDGRGALHASTVYKKGSALASSIVFQNSYTASPVSAEIEGEKLLSGRELIEGEFEFVLTNTGNGRVIESVTNDAKGGFKFAPLEYRVADTYHYTVTEKNSGLEGVSYDASVYSVIVKVVDDKNGSLNIESIEYILNGEATEGITFENKYSARAVSVELNGIKQLDGRELLENEFEFNLYETDSSFATDGIEPITVTNGSDGKFTFPTLEYNEIGTKYYVITESDGGAASITYDTEVYRVKVDITDNLRGVLLADVDLQKSDGNGAETILFVNKYTELDVDVKLNVSKTVVIDGDGELGADGFEFLLTRDGVEVGRAITDENGNASFILTFKEEDVNKTFTYVMSEINGGAVGVTYDKTEYTFEILITYDESGKCLAATVTKDGERENAYIAEFTNIYSVTKPGDSSTMLPWMLLLLISGGAVVKVASRSNKKREEF